MSVIRIAILIWIIGSGIPQVILAIFRKRKKLDSFVISEDNNKIFVKNSPPVVYLNSVSQFFNASLFGLIILTTVEIEINLLMRLGITCVFSALVFYVEIRRRKKYKIIIDRNNNSIILKRKTYSLDEFNQLEINDRRIFWGGDESTYALYIKNSKNEYKFAYGYSIYKDIENLKLQLEMRMNRR